MRSKEERRTLHRTQIRDRNSLNNPVSSIGNNRKEYVQGGNGVYQHIKLDGADFYVKLKTHKDG
tara:strand:- start:974 stop:1165 length:192 start_codon:yes stop_codon:yes gene_type:complete